MTNGVQEEINKSVKRRLATLEELEKAASKDIHAIHLDLRSITTYMKVGSWALAVVASGIMTNTIKVWFL